MKNSVRLLVVAFSLVLSSLAAANPCEKAKTLAENDLVKDQKGRVLRVLGQFLDGDYLIENPETRKPERMAFTEAQKLEHLGTAPVCGKLMSNH